ncbi:MAG: hypothetical protein R2856_18410 [Caldilineaceae bacterium]
MCGIVGYIGHRDAAAVVVDGLRRLEYRGYDSAGVAVLNGHGIEVRREAGKLAQLESLLTQQPIAGPLGIGHTRWATHGPPSQRNAHPHSSPDAAMVVVQNGIVENFQPLRRQLQDLGYVFHSDTDTEVIVHLIHSHYHNGSERNLVHAVRCAAAELEGPSAIGVICENDPEQPSMDLRIFRPVL